MECALLALLLCGGRDGLRSVRRQIGNHHAPQESLLAHHRPAVCLVAFENAGARNFTAALSLFMLLLNATGTTLAPGIFLLYFLMKTKNGDVGLRPFYE